MSLLDKMEDRGLIGITGNPSLSVGLELVTNVTSKGDGKSSLSLISGGRGGYDMTVSDSFASRFGDGGCYALVVKRGNGVQMIAGPISRGEIFVYDTKLVDKLDEAYKAKPPR